MRQVNWKPLKKVNNREGKTKGILKKAMRIREHRKELNKLSKKRVTYQQAKENLAKIERREYWANDFVFCTVDYDNYDKDKPQDSSNYVSIGIHHTEKLVDGECGIGWQIKQWIKNEILGDNWEAVELYPAEVRLMNTSNEYWLFCYDSIIPFGFKEPRNVTDCMDGGFGRGARQDLLVRENEYPEITRANKKNEQEVI